VDGDRSVACAAQLSEHKLIGAVESQAFDYGAIVSGRPLPIYPGPSSGVPCHSRTAAANRNLDLLAIVGLCANNSNRRSISPDRESPSYRRLLPTGTEEAQAERVPKSFGFQLM